MKKSRGRGYRSRAAYKLLELDEKFGLLKGVKGVVDLGIAPGGWSQVVRRRGPQPRSPASTCCRPTPSTAWPFCRWISWTTKRLNKLREALGLDRAGSRHSDMAANTVGHPQTDHLRTMGLVEAGMLFATEVLPPGGAYVAKVLAGGADAW